MRIHMLQYCTYAALNTVPCSGDRYGNDFSTFTLVTIVVPQNIFRYRDKHIVHIYKVYLWSPHKIR